MFSEKVLSIILGGGQGSRLYPLTDNRSKPAVPIAGEYRLVDVPISNCINSNFKRIFVLTQFNSASLNRHIKNTYHFSFFSSAFVDVLAAEQTPMSQTWFQGTADAVRQSMHHFLKHDFEYFLILSGDQLYQMDLQLMLDNHIESNAEISIATIPVNAKEATSFGILKANENNQITSFIEKPSKELLVGWESAVSPEMEEEGREYLASMGIYIFNRSLLIELLANPDTVDFGKEILPQSIDRNRVFSYQFEGYWTDIGTIESFFKANLGLADDFPKFDLYNKSKTIYTNARMLPTSKVSGTQMYKAVVASGCIINAEKIEYSVIGIRSKIENGSTVINTYMMGSDFYQALEDILDESIVNMGIGKNCYIKNAILDKNCCIGDNVKIEGGPHLEEVDTETYTVRDGIVIVKKGAVIPSNFTI
ncbi:glucose-1-phosphate adenylyltransferase [Flavobacterium jejuense]|uniref:Glucose-1-phosphate adenylyltransferase n=1 Tax=Flavobacterium jejuense TaxID=1544455 RepID=A0ABX0IYR0_9FLAO|nr:glucose-1-phosphate adenylyltransferase [Flavobacterium jejuense]NHN27703.1 glucose-1-phosphate adenylyltransferase [Flavobacterium jejuense]